MEKQMKNLVMSSIKWVLVVFTFFVSCVVAADNDSQTTTGISSNYFEYVLCASETHSLAKILNKKGQAYTNEAVEFSRLSEKYTKLSIESGLKSGKPEEHTKQSIEYLASTAYNLNEKCIEKNGFETCYKHGFGMSNLKCKE